MRVTTPILTTPGPDGDRVFGLGDTVLLDFFLFQTSHSTFATGPAVGIPTATDDTLGSGKLELGPNFLWIYHGVKKTTLGVLAENLTSVAGSSDRPSVNTLLWQPIFTRHFKWGYLSWSGQQWSYDWNSKDWSIPLGVIVGKVFMAKTPWNIQVEPYYTINQGRSNQYGIKFGWTMIVPGFHW